MDAHPGDWWTRVQAFLSEGLWRQEFEPRTWHARGAGFLRFSIMVGEGFVRDQLLLRSSALTYFTVLSIVPVLAIVSAVVTAFGVTENVVGPVIDQFAEVSPQVAERLRDFVQNADIRSLGAYGALALLLTTVLGISNIERALNHVWGVKQERPLMRKLVDYLAVLIVAPMLLAVGLALATTVKSQWIVQELLEYPAFETVYAVGLSQLPSLMLAFAFAFLYWFMPNTTVRPVGALLGAAVAAVVVNAALGLYVGTSVGVAKMNALYGGFAQLPLFFVWVYFFWAIVLFGAEVAFAYQHFEHYQREVRAELTGPAQREAVGLRMAIEIALRFCAGAEPWTSDELADALSVPVRTVREVLVPLQEMRIVSSVDVPGTEHGLQLGRPADTIRVVDVLAALRGERDPGAGDPGVRQATDRLLEELAEGEAKAADGQTLADVIVRIQRGDRGPSDAS